MTDQHEPLTPRQIVMLTLYGAALWLLAAMLVRVLVPMGALNGWATALTYALVVPGTFPALWLARRIAGLATAQMATGITVVTAAALLLDGVAFAWMPTLYAADATGALAGAAVILWGAGVGLVLGLAMGRG